ncbi:Glyoxylase, beta-lactamase superfamily II [Nocardiopsis flavescens]|uniref:Glyoxylase, beta-lactamase superfamily II n=1 Tax=Nocardiopsis flavescens TaxID=758803 RepID=A0A1M6LFS8_9ACTN|nr:MBL fold metallo-hydrolase [Nocardiopsis flavescens]SHJ70059.1 Glyoxylase, beta-lactamase superfamily II [Nocardiopsis flavescens]
MLTEVAAGVFTHRSELLRNNTVVVRGTDGVLVVDAGITGPEMACLADDLRGLGLPVVAGFATHPDWDHVLWHPDLGDAPRYSTARCAAAMRDLRAAPDWRARVTGGLPPEVADDIPLDPFGLITEPPAGTGRVPWDGPEVRIVEHPAHSPGHAALLVPERGVLAAGDMLSDVFVPMLDGFTGGNDPIGEYLAGLRLLEGVVDGVDVVVPGHGSVGRGGEIRERIGLDRAYLLALRDGGAFDDRRIVAPFEPGWEWVADIHAGQLRRAARWNGREGSPG